VNLKTATHLAVLLSLTGCQKNEEAPEVPAPVQAPTEETAPPAQDPKTLPKAAVRYATPARVVAMRTMSEGGIGTITGKFMANAEAPLLAVGLNRCQTGWVIQGMHPKDGTFSATHPILIQLPDPAAKPFKYKVPDAPGHIELDFETFSESRVKGTMKIIDENAETHLSMTMDGAPISVLPGPETGEQGCFTSGFWGFSDEVPERPVVAVFDGKNAHYVSLKLDEKHAIALLMDLRAHVKNPKSVLRGDIKRINQAPERFPFRVFFEKIKEEEPETETGPVFETQQIAAREGTFMARFNSDSRDSNLRIEIRDLQFPSWDGPLAGQTVDVIRAETLFYTKDAKIVPIPSRVQEESLEEITPKPQETRDSEPQD
jgi:hypothetical protein